MLLGIVMGSTVSIAIGLALTGVVLLLLPEYRERLAGEFGAFGRTFTGALGLAVLAAASFFGELKLARWRGYAHLALLAALAAVVLRYWPG